MMGFPLSLPVEVTTPRKWAIYHEVGEVFGPDDDHDGPVLLLALTAAEAVAVAHRLMATLGQPEALDSDLAAKIGWAGEQ
jgi:hypothetical protein